MEMNNSMIEELNKQMLNFQEEYAFSQNNSVNFPQQSDIATTQIKRPTRTTGTHRNEINEKMTEMKMNQPMMVVPNQFQNAIPVLAQGTRNNSQYQTPEGLVNKQHMQNLPNLLEKHYQREENNPLSAYFQQNYSTLNGNKHLNPSLEQSTSGYSHESGQSFINPNNLPCITHQSPMQMHQHQQPGNGFHKIDEKRIDYRQNMNSAVGNFIFDNPNAARYNPQQVAYNPNHFGNTNAKDTRMVIQERSKDMYRNEANSRMAQYSPLARASHIPIDIANMSVNDFYANMNSNNGNRNNLYQTAEEDARAILNSRLNAYPPLAKTTPLEKPKIWQDNVNKINPLVVYDELPIISHN